MQRKRIIRKLTEAQKERSIKQMLNMFKRFMHKQYGDYNKEKDYWDEFVKRGHDVYNSFIYDVIAEALIDANFSKEAKKLRTDADINKYFNVSNFDTEKGHKSEYDEFKEYAFEYGTKLANIATWDANKIKDVGSQFLKLQGMDNSHINKLVIENKMNKLQENKLRRVIRKIIKEQQLNEASGYSLKPAHRKFIYNFLMNNDSSDGSKIGFEIKDKNGTQYLRGMGQTLASHKPGDMTVYYAGAMGNMSQTAINSIKRQAKKAGYKIEYAEIGNK